MRLRRPPAQLLTGLLVVAAALLLASVLGRIVLFSAPWFPLRLTIARLTHVDFEQSVPTLYSILLLLSCAALLAVIAFLRRHDGAHDARSWAALTGLVALAAVDEALSIHEMAIEPTASALGSRATGLLYFAWVVPATTAMLVLGFVFLRFVVGLPRDTRNRLLLAAALYFGGALGMEAVGGKVAHDAGYDTLTDVERETEFRDATYVVVSTAEEGLELAGTSVLLYALAAHLTVHLGGLRVRLSYVDGRAPHAGQARR